MTDNKQPKKNKNERHGNVPLREERRDSNDKVITHDYPKNRQTPIPPPPSEAPPKP
ncbi:MAG: hypothetical protein VYE22_24220 [Myxococcota bacterium]|nr:hypothetical protein [Myxococcota bacterium]